MANATSAARDDPKVVLGGNPRAPSSRGKHAEPGDDRGPGHGGHGSDD